MATTVEGTVSRVNGNGFKLDNGDWLNISKYANAGDAPMPAMGERVKVTLDEAGFVRKVEQIAAPPQVEAPQPAQASTGMAIGEKDRLIVRQSSLKAAVEVLAAGGKEVSPAEVLDLAEVFEQWVYRPAA